jgi:Zn-dependent peptidase ImmA (M78 family)
MLSASLGAMTRLGDEQRGSAAVAAPRLPLWSEDLMQQAERDAQQILDAVWVSGRRPVDPFQIARSLGIRVYVDQGLEPDVAGMLVKQPGYDDPEIVLNANDSRNRQRFTCAHELGHYNKRSKSGDFGEWHFVDRRDSLSGQGSNPDEIYANQFAAALLMPAPWVRELADRYEVPALAFEFGVSADAMTYRLKNLGL